MSKGTLALASIAFLVACNGGSFAGDSGQYQGGEPRPAAGAGPDDERRSDDLTSRQDTDRPRDRDGPKADAGDDADGDDTGEGDDGSTGGDGATPGHGEGDGDGGDGGVGGDDSEKEGLLGSGILEKLGELLKILKDVEINRPGGDEREIVFGGQRVFHIGDDAFDQSSCKAAIHAYPLTGTVYYFEFDVMEDDTRVDIAIERVCGVDYPDSNFANLSAGAGKLHEQGVPAGATQIVFPAKTLAKGRHTVAVESRRGAARNPNDNDDFIIGLVRIKGDKPLKPGRVGARK